MKRYEKLKKLSDKKFKRAIGIPRLLFEIYILVITEALEIRHKKGGRKPKLSAEDILLLMLYYYRDYTTFFKLGLEFGIDESNSYRWVKWCEETLIEYSRELFDGSNMNLDNEYIVDVMECHVERPKNQELQREFYSGKKKKHTIKIQIVIEENTKKIVFVSFDKGSVHDFSLFKQSTSNFYEMLKFLADSGYQGIQNLFLNSLTPKKKSKKNPLIDEDKELNHLISTIRISIEHVNCQLKFFRILSERYRNRKETFFLRALFICSVYNFCL